MKNIKTNFEIYKEQLLTDPELKAKYDAAREKIKLEMMLEILRLQIENNKSKRAILGQITKISNTLTRTAFYKS